MYKENFLAKLGNASSNDEFLVKILEESKYCTNNMKLSTYIDLIKERSMEKVCLDEDNVLLALTFIKSCYSAGIITYSELKSFINKIEEKTNE